MRILPAFAFTLISTAALAASPPLGGGYGAIDSPRDIDPVALAEAFCAGRISGDMSAIESYFAPKLRRLLDEHAHLQPASAVPWQTYADRPTACRTEVEGADDIIGVIVRVDYTSDMHRWSDRLNLERTPDSWRINNVFYEAGGNLRFKLFDSLGT